MTDIPRSGKLTNVQATQLNSGAKRCLVNGVLPRGGF